MGSKLPVSMLGKIWDLSDQDKDGLLDRYEFTVAMHLVYRALQGDEIPDQVMTISLSLSLITNLISRCCSFPPSSPKRRCPLHSRLRWPCRTSTTELFPGWVRELFKFKIFIFISFFSLFCFFLQPNSTPTIDLTESLRSNISPSPRMNGLPILTVRLLFCFILFL